NGLVPRYRGAGFDRLAGTNRIQPYQTLHWLVSEHVLTVELCHPGVFGVLLNLVDTGLVVTRADLFFATVLRDAQIVQRVVGFRVDVLHVELELMTHVGHAHFFTAGEDLVAAMLLIQLGEGWGRWLFFDGF